MSPRRRMSAVSSSSSLRWLVIATAAMLAHVLAAAAAVPEANIMAASSSPRPHLTSVFVSLAVRPHWNASRWHTLVEDLKAIEVQNIILADSVTESEAWYPTRIPGLTYTGADVVRIVIVPSHTRRCRVLVSRRPLPPTGRSIDLLLVHVVWKILTCGAMLYGVVNAPQIGMALRAAQRGGLTVYAGMLLPADWFHHGAMNATYLRDLTARENAVAAELHSIYGEAFRGTLRGMYHAAEVYSTCCYSRAHRCDPQHVAALASLLEPTGQLVHSLSPEYKYVIAPFAANASSPEGERAWWASLLQLTPSVDVVAFQDGVGVSAGKRSPQHASELIRAVSAAVAQQEKMSMWTDIEVFTHPNYTGAAALFHAAILTGIQLCGVCSCWQP